MKNLPVNPSVRSRSILSDLIFEPLYNEFGVAPAEEATKWLKKTVFGVSKNTKEKEAKTPAKILTFEEAKKAAKLDQIVVLGEPEIDYMLQVAREYCHTTQLGEKGVKEKELEKKLRENLKALGKGAVGLDAALFGRMTTADLLARSDAAVHVAHALTVHSERVETDYFTAVDDFATIGSAHINNTELTSSVFYGYVVVDFPLLISNLMGCKREEWHLQDFSLPIQTIQMLLYLIATVSPGAKKGSTAPYSYSNFILAEVGNAQPCSLANAFLDSIKTTQNMVGNACSKLCAYVNKIDKMYGFGNKRALASIETEFEPVDHCERFDKMEELTLWLNLQLNGRND